MGDKANRIGFHRKAAMDIAGNSSDWRNEIITNIPFSKSSKVPEELVESLQNVYVNVESSLSSKPSHEIGEDDNDDTNPNRYPMTSPTQIRTCYSTQPVTIDLSTTTAPTITKSPYRTKSRPSPAHINARIIRVDCSGSKVPIRSLPTVKAATLRYLYSGAEMEVLPDKVKGYYQLTNGNGYVNSKTSGVDWFDVTPLDLRSIEESNVVEEDEEDEKTVNNSNPTTFKYADLLSVKNRSKSEMNSICISEYPPDFLVNLFVNSAAPAPAPALNTSTSTSYESGSMYPLPPESGRHQSPDSPLSASPYSMFTRTLPLTHAPMQVNSHDDSTVDSLTPSPVQCNSHDDGGTDLLLSVPLPLFPVLCDPFNESGKDSVSNISIAHVELIGQYNSCAPNVTSTFSVSINSCPLTTPHISQHNIEAKSTHETPLTKHNQIHMEQQVQIQYYADSSARIEWTKVSPSVFRLDSSKFHDHSNLYQSHSSTFDTQDPITLLVTNHTTTDISTLCTVPEPNPDTFALTLPHQPLPTYSPAGHVIALPHFNTYSVTLTPACCLAFRIKVGAVMGWGGCDKSTFLRGLLEALFSQCCINRRGISASIESDMLSQSHIRPVYGNVTDAGNGAVVSIPIGHVRILSEYHHEVEICLYVISTCGDCVNKYSSLPTPCDSLLSRHWELDVQSLTEDRSVSSDEHLQLHIVSVPHWIRTIDELFLRRMPGLIPVAPVIWKADAMTLREKTHYLQQATNKLSNVSKQLGLDQSHTEQHSREYYPESAGVQILTYPWTSHSDGQHRLSLQSDVLNSETGLMDLVDDTELRSAQLHCFTPGIQRQSIPSPRAQERNITLDILTRHVQQQYADNYDDSTCETMTDMTSFSQFSSPLQNSSYNYTENLFLEDPDLQAMTVAVSPTLAAQRQFLSCGDASPSSILFRSRTTPRPNEAHICLPPTLVNLKLNLSESNTRYSSAFIDYSEAYPIASEDYAIEALDQSVSSSRFNEWWESEPGLNSRSNPSTGIGGRETSIYNRPVSARSGMSGPMSTRSALSDPKSARSVESDPLSARSRLSETTSARSGQRLTETNSKPTRVSNDVRASRRSLWSRLSSSVSRKNSRETERKGKDKGKNNNLGADSDPKDFYAYGNGSARSGFESKRWIEVNKPVRRRLVAIGCAIS